MPLSPYIQQKRRVSLAHESHLGYKRSYVRDIERAHVVPFRSPGTEVAAITSRYSKIGSNLRAARIDSTNKTAISTKVSDTIRKSNKTGRKFAAHQTELTGATIQSFGYDTIGWRESTYIRDVLARTGAPSDIVLGRSTERHQWTVLRHKIAHHVTRGRILEPSRPQSITDSIKAEIERDAPLFRAERLIKTIDVSAHLRRPVKESAETLKRLAQRFSEVRVRLSNCLQDNSHPQLRWIAMEILAPLCWDELVPQLVVGLRTWNANEARAAWLGAVLTIRRHRVPQDMRGQVLEILRERLKELEPISVSGDELGQTELACHCIDTLRDFAVAADLSLLSRFWQNDCIFPIQLRAVEAATNIASRNPRDAAVDAFFSTEAPKLGERLRHLAGERLVAVENGTLLWRIIGLLFARLGSEGNEVVPISRDYPKLKRRILKIFEDSERYLGKSGNDPWLKQRNVGIDVLRSELADGKK